MTRFQPSASAAPDQELRFDRALSEFGAALDRLARSYEADADKRDDLLQEIHLAVWRSFASFDERCSLRTWVYRVAHNIAATHVIKQRRTSARLVGLDALASVASDSDAEGTTDRTLKLERLHGLLWQLRPIDRQIMLLYLEECDSATIAEITGLSATNVTTKIGRIKTILGRLHENRRDA